MNGKIKVLLLDSDSDRSQKVLQLLIADDRFYIDSKEHIQKKEFEEGNYDVYMIHESNKPEGRYIIEEYWTTGNSQLIMFSESYRKNKTSYDGIIYLRADYLRDQNNVQKLLNEILKK